MKRWYASKTIWVNVLAAICLAIQAKWGFVIDAEAQGAILIVANVILRGVTKDAITLALLLSLAGCSSTNISDLVKAQATNPRGWCAILNAGPYGGGTIAVGSPDVSVQVSASGCSIEGSNVTRVTVPTGSITVTPPK